MSKRMNWDKVNSRKVEPRSSKEIPPSASQLRYISALCREVGVKNKKPKNMSEAGQIIAQLKEAKKKGVKPKHRRPAVPINGKIVGN